MTVDIDNLKTLLELLGEQNVAEFEHETEGVRVRIVRGGVTQATVVGAPLAPPVPIARPSEPLPLDVLDVTSPFVGTFYRAPTPDTPPFVEVGSIVRPAQTLCIIEAMKLMNEIEAEVSGTVVEIFAQNGKPVEFGQKLFRIKKA
jgi:acetyl-CoA carboxylase biotin carboxyl carrier protein